MHGGLPQPVPHVDQRVAAGGVDAGEAAHIQDEEELRRLTLPPLHLTRNAILFIGHHLLGMVVERKLLWHIRTQSLQGLLDDVLRPGRVRKVEVAVELERDEALPRVDVLVELGAQVEVGEVCLLGDLDEGAERHAEEDDNVEDGADDEAEVDVEQDGGPEGQEPDEGVAEGSLEVNGQLGDLDENALQGDDDDGGEDALQQILFLNWNVAWIKKILTNGVSANKGPAKSKTQSRAKTDTAVATMDRVPALSWTVDL